MEGIEFTDRYGGRMPSGITACHTCEAMGCYPEPPAGCRDEQGRLPIDDPRCHSELWTFETCSDCGGTGRVPLSKGLLRVPGLWGDAARFVWHTRTFYGPRRPTPAQWWLSFKIAFLYDWFLLSRRTAHLAR